MYLDKIAQKFNIGYLLIINHNMKVIISLSVLIFCIGAFLNIFQSNPL